jgi:hypothetical protein
MKLKTSEAVWHPEVTMLSIACARRLSSTRSDPRYQCSFRVIGVPPFQVAAAAMLTPPRFGPAHSAYSATSAR